MLELHQIVMGLAPVLGTNVGIIEQIIKGIYCVSSGGVTMKNIARWTNKGCSYRTVQRFFSAPTDWLQLNLLLLRHLIIGVPDSNRYVLALDEVVEGKSGKQTFGIDWFYSSIAGQAIRSVSNHVISLVDTEKEKSFVLTHKQTVKPPKLKQDKKPSSKKSSKKSKEAIKKKPKGKSGRPKGSKNKQNVKKIGLLYTSFEYLLGLVVPLVKVLCPMLRYVLADGAYGNKTCCLIVGQFDLDLICKLNRNTALFLPYQGKYGGRGRPKKYGKKLDYQKLPANYLVSSIEEEGICTNIYQIKEVWTRKMPSLINVVIIIKIDIATQKASRVVLFSTDLNLEAGSLIKFYSLRFQIEFNFRDAKQYFGLADFKNIKPTQVNNAVGLAFFMDNISMILLQKAQVEWKEEKLSIQDLKAYFRAQKYLRDILNTLEIDQKDILNLPQMQQIMKIGAVNRTKTDVIAA